MLTMAPDFYSVGMWPIVMLLLEAIVLSVMPHAALVSILSDWSLLPLSDVSLSHQVIGTSTDIADRFVFRRKLKLQVSLYPVPCPCAPEVVSVRVRVVWQWLNQFNEEDRTFHVDTLSRWIDQSPEMTPPCHKSSSQKSASQLARAKLQKELSLFEVDESELDLNEVVAAGGAGQVRIGSYCAHKVAVKQIYTVLMEGARDSQGLTEISKEVRLSSNTGCGSMGGVCCVFLSCFVTIPCL